MALNQAFIFKIIKFGIVGFLGFVIDFGLTYVFKEKLKMNKFVANALGFLISALVNFTVNRMWTFENHNPDLAMQLGKFMAIASVALMLNSLIIYILNGKIRINFYVSKIIAVLFVMFYNFIMNSLFTFVK
jgi:putative flippase GtrA